jgi:hypothetical protein
VVCIVFRIESYRQFEERVVAGEKAKRARIIGALGR